MVRVALFVLWFVPLVILADQGKVVGVHDGDTITVLIGKASVKVRVIGVDAPEIGQPFGSAAKSATSNLVFGQIVDISTNQSDRYGRIVSKVTLSDGRDLGLELIRSGHAWHYAQYARRERAYAEAQQAAHRAKIGLWKDPRPIAPWDWRKTKRRPQ